MQLAGLRALVTGGTQGTGAAVVARRWWRGCGWPAQRC
jgi:NAD(P)-dependent dehydrogenase (short-subunit alcohol dehydrogenase family)